MNFLTTNWLTILVVLVLGWIAWRYLARNRSGRSGSYPRVDSNSTQAERPVSSEKQADQQPAQKHHGCC